MTESEVDNQSDRLIVEVFDREGRLVSRSVGPSAAERLADHERGECAATCSHCHADLAGRIGEDAALRTMFERTFNKPAPW